MSVKGLHSGIKFYLDSECKVPIAKVKWNSGFHITMASGKVESLINTAKAGEMAAATFYARNETHYRFGIQEFSFPDKRVHAKADSDWLDPSQPVKITLSVQISSEPTAKEVVESAQFIISGFFIIGGDR